MARTKQTNLAPVTQLHADVGFQLARVALSKAAASGGGLGSVTAILTASPSADNEFATLAAATAALDSALPGPKFLAWGEDSPTDAGSFALPVDVTMIGGLTFPATVTLGEVGFERAPSSIEGMSLTMTSDAIVLFPDTAPNELEGVRLVDATLEATGTAPMFSVTGDSARVVLEGATVLVGGTIVRSTDGDVFVTVRGAATILAGTLDAPSGSVEIRIEAPGASVHASYLSSVHLVTGVVFAASGDPEAAGVVAGSSGCLYENKDTGILWSFDGSVWKQVNPQPVQLAYALADLQTFGSATFVVADMSGVLPADTKVSLAEMEVVEALAGPSLAGVTLSMQSVSGDPDGTLADAGSNSTNPTAGFYTGGSNPYPSRTGVTAKIELFGGTTFAQLTAGSVKFRFVKQVLPIG